jgi:hypothetical protein
MNGPVIPATSIEYLPSARIEVCLVLAGVELSCTVIVPTIGEPAAAVPEMVVEVGGGVDEPPLPPPHAEMAAAVTHVARISPVRFIPFPSRVEKL